MKPTTTIAVVTIVLAGLAGMGAHAQLPDPIPVRERTIYIERYPTLYEVRMCDFPEVDNRLAFDFDDFVASSSIA